MLGFVGVSFFLFAIGASIGSFLNVVIYRTVRDESWISGRSLCEHCRKKIKWHDNIPLLSFFLLKGRSRCCKKSLSISHPVVEFLTGTLFVWWYWGGAFFFRLTQAPFQTLQPLFWLMVGVLLLMVFFADLLYTIIPDVAAGGLLFIALIYRLVLTSSGVMKTQDLLYSLVGMLSVTLFFALLWKLTKGQGMGMGDVKLSAPLALLLGWPKMLVGFFASFLLGAGISLILILFKKKKFGQVVPFGPFMVLGTVLALLWGEAIFSWYLGWL